MSEPIEIRDLRKQDWIWTSKALLFHVGVDASSYKTYCGLAAFADNRSQEAFPSIETLALRLHMGRNTVIRALQKLEALHIISVERATGTHNIYTLLDVPCDEIPKRPKVPKQETPAGTAREFFKGVADISDKKLETPEAGIVIDLLKSIKEKYHGAEKQVIWQEIKSFEQYWTELNGTGTKMKWEKQETFEVYRRLITWFRNKNQFARTSHSTTKGSKVAVL